MHLIVISRFVQRPAESEVPKTSSFTEAPSFGKGPKRLKTSALKSPQVKIGNLCLRKEQFEGSQ